MLKILRTFAADIKLLHSVFALPFVGVGLCLSTNVELSAEKLIKIVFCMVFARSFAMGVNRIADSEIDAKNNRTANRAIPSGGITLVQAKVLTGLNALMFVGVASMFSFKVGALSVLLLGVLAAYSFMKRISFLTHWYLGFCLGLAPIAAELALTDQISLGVSLIGIAVAFWTAGFDILYSLQDQKFDMEMNLNSAPAVLGHVNALRLSVGSFALMILSLVAAGLITGAGTFYFAGVGVVLLILIMEQWIIRDAWQAGESKNIGMAFFNYNAYVSVSFFAFVLVDKIWNKYV